MCECGHDSSDTLPDDDWHSQEPARRVRGFTVRELKQCQGRRRITISGAAAERFREVMESNPEPTERLKQAIRTAREIREFQDQQSRETPRVCRPYRTAIKERP